MIRSNIKSILPVLLTLAGCGGSGHSGSSSNSAQNALVGSWTGTYRAYSGAPAGTISITIARDPVATGLNAGLRIAGTAQDATYGAATVTGFVYDDTSVDTYAGGSNISLTYTSGDDTFVGRPTLGASGHLVGPLVEILGDVREPVTLDLAPVKATP